MQPTAQINYLKTSTGEWLAHCGACPVPELANAFNRAGITYRCINGLLGHNGRLFEKIFNLLNIPCVTLNK